jgi:peptide/nickel transport system permease protein
VSAPTDKPVVPAAESPSLSYWQMSLRDFRRNRMGMAGLLVVWFVATVGVFAPLIANGRPLFLRMVFADDYDEAYFIVLESAGRVAALRTGESQAPAREVLATFDRAVRRMQRSLTAEDGDRLAAVTDQLRRPLRDAAAPFDAAVHASLLAEFERAFDIDAMTLVPQDRYPALRGLQRPEIFFMLLYIACIAALPFRRWLAPWTRTAGVALLVAALGTIVWSQFFPPIHDTFPYRRHYEAAGFAERGGKVLLCPVPYGENENITAENRQPPTFLLAPDKRVPNQHFHLMGTDTNGRDVLARMVYGARISMMIGIVAVSIYLSIGMFLGALAGFYGGWIDLALSRLIEIVICFPVLFLILSIQAFAPRPSILNIMVVLGLVSWTGVARLQRGEFIRLGGRDFVQAVRALGGSNARIIFNHILPNALGPILVTASFGIAGSIVVESALSFLGFGVPQPMASWGDLLNNGRNDIQGTWWLTVFPGLAIFITVTCFNLVGEAVRDALDPRREH